MTNFNRMTASRRNTTAFPMPTGFKIMVGLVSTIIAIGFVTVIVFMVMTFSGNAPFSYHYEINYGNGSYSESSTWGESE